MYSFIETKLFTHLVAEYLSDDEYSELQKALIATLLRGTWFQVPVESGSCVGV
jgi:hypothetical protein